MADDTFPVDEKMKFHPTDSPRGTLFYNLEELTKEQQIQLNALKIKTIRDDEKYLAEHPEIRAIIVLLLRVLFKHRPMIKTHEFIAKFFNRSESDIADDVEDYLEARKDHVYEDISAIDIAQHLKNGKIEKEESIEERPLDYICAESCVCDHTMEWKMPYQRHDAMSFTETEHWMTPKTSKTSMTMDDSHHGGTTDEYFSLTDLAKMIHSGSSEEEEDETRFDDDKRVSEGFDVDDMFFMGQSSSEVSITARKESGGKSPPNVFEDRVKTPSIEPEVTLKSPPNEFEVKVESPPNEGEKRVKKKNGGKSKGLSFVED